MDYSSIIFREFTHESFERIGRYRQEEIDPKRVPNKELAVGQTLPQILQNKFPIELIGKPIEEIDYYYRTDDVCIIFLNNLYNFFLNHRYLWLLIEIKQYFDLVQHHLVLYFHHLIIYDI